MIKQGLLKSSTTLKGLVSSKFFPVLQDAILDFDFENSRYFTPSSGYYSNFIGTTGLTFTRSNGTYFDSNGNIVTAQDNKPRLDHDPATGAPLGLLVEEERTNILEYSNVDMDNWQPVQATRTPLSLGALGVFDGVEIASAGQEFHRTNHPDISVTSGTMLVFTFFYREGTGDKMRITLRDPDTGNQTQFGGTIGQPYTKISQAIGDLGDYTETLLSDGLTYRLTLQFTPNYTGTMSVGIGPFSNTVGDSLIALGAQMEEGTFALSFIPTNGSQITCTGDFPRLENITFPATPQGTIYVETRTKEADTAAPYIVQMDDGFNSDRYLMRFDTSPRVRCFAIENANTTYNFSINDPTAESVFIKVGFSFDGTSLFLASGGDSVQNLNGDPIPVDTTNMSIGCSLFGTANHLNGHLKRLAFIPRKYSIAELEAITS